MIKLFIYFSNDAENEIIFGLQSTSSDYSNTRYQRRLNYAGLYKINYLSFLLLITFIRDNSLKRSSSVSPDLEKMRKVLNPTNVGDLNIDNFSTPRRARKNLKMVKTKFVEKQSKCNNLKKQVKRLQNQVFNYENLIKSLKNKALISESAAHQLQVFVLIIIYNYLTFVNMQRCKNIFL